VDAAEATRNEQTRNEPTGLTIGDLIIAIFGFAIVFVFAAAPFDWAIPDFHAGPFFWRWLDTNTGALQGRLDSLCVVLLLVSLARMRLP
jgi:hypothetical protein